VLVVEVVKNVKQIHRPWPQHAIDLPGDVVHVVQITIDVRPFRVTTRVVVRGRCNCSVNRIRLDLCEDVEAIPFRKLRPLDSGFECLSGRVLRYRPLHNEAPEEAGELEFVKSLPCGGWLPPFVHDAAPKPCGSKVTSVNEQYPVPV